MNSENTSGKNFIPSVPAVLRIVVGDELVGELRERLQPARHQAARGGRADQQRADDADRDHHEQRRIGEGDLVPADVGDREDLVDLELMDRIGHDRFGLVCP